MPDKEMIDAKSLIREIDNLKYNEIGTKKWKELKRKIISYIEMRKMKCKNQVGEWDGCCDDCYFDNGKNGCSAESTKWRGFKLNGIKFSD